MFKKNGWLIIAICMALLFASCIKKNPDETESMSIEETERTTQETSKKPSELMFDENDTCMFFYSGNDPKDEAGTFFYIALYKDGTYTWFENPVSSFLGAGTYTMEGDILILMDDPDSARKTTNRFRLINEGEEITYIAEGSDNSPMVSLSDGEGFRRGALVKNVNIKPYYVLENGKMIAMSLGGPTTIGHYYRFRQEVSGVDPNTNLHVVYTLLTNLDKVSYEEARKWYEYGNPTEEGVVVDVNLELRENGEPTVRRHK